MIPLFALWANVDESFAIGLILLAFHVIGSGLKPGPTEPEEAKAPGMVPGLIVLGLCVLACLANPSTFWVYADGFGPLIEVFGPAPETLLHEQVTLLPFGTRGETSQLSFRGEYPKVLGIFLILVILGLGSFLLNRRRFDLGRLMIFLASVLLTVLLWRLQVVMSIVLAMCLVLNGQEWYQSTFGTEGKLSLGWRVWSVGGRLLTLALLTAATLGGVTGYGKLEDEPLFGFGLEADRFAFEAADYLRDAPIDGQVMNLRLALGDSLNWRSYPNRRSFVDSRLPRAASDLLNEYDVVRNSLVAGEDEKWREILDRYEVSVLMVDIPIGAELRSALTDALDASPDWVLFYDDGAVMLYGRLDETPTVSQADRDFFATERLDSEAIAFNLGNPPRPFDRPPQPTDMLDLFSNARALAPIQPHVFAAQRWFDRGIRKAGGLDNVPDIASSMLAIQEARDALAVRPDDPVAFLVLSMAYRYLGQREGELLVAAKEPTVMAGRVTAPTLLRQQQRITALNSFIQTLPKPPRSVEKRAALRGAHFELAQLYEAAGYLDLTRDQLGAVLEYSDLSDATTEEELAAIEGLRLGFDNLTEQVELIRTQVEQAELEGQVDPAQLGMMAVRQGLAELGLRYLMEAEQSGVGLATVRIQLVDLLCDIGRPDQAIPYLSGGDEQSLSNGPGTAQFRQGRVYFLMGDYRTASELWRSLALPQLRASRAQEALQTATLMMTGQAMSAVQTALNVPAQLQQQADWEYLLGVTLLEGGFPAEAGEPLRASLELVPRLTARPIAAFYLEKLGLEVPPIPVEDAEEEADTPASAEVEAEPAPSTETGADAADPATPEAETPAPEASAPDEPSTTEPASTPEP